MKDRSLGRGWTEWICFEVFQYRPKLVEALRRFSMPGDVTPIGTLLYPRIGKDVVSYERWAEYRWAEHLARVKARKRPK